MHFIYMLTVHKMIDVDEAMDRLEEVITKGPKFKNWFRVLMCTSCQKLILL